VVSGYISRSPASEGPSLAAWSLHLAVARIVRYLHRQCGIGGTIILTSTLTSEELCRRVSQLFTHTSHTIPPIPTTPALLTQPSPPHSNQLSSFPTATPPAPAKTSTDQIPARDN